MKISRKWLVDFALGATSVSVLVFLFDDILYPFAIWKLGLVWGGLMMASFSAILCFGALIFYDRVRRDLLGLEALKTLREYEGGRVWGKVFSWILKRGDGAAFLFLSIVSNPFVATVYLRRGAYAFDGMRRREWSIFVMSFLLSNASWTFACFMGVSFVEWVVGVR